MSAAARIHEVLDKEQSDEEELIACLQAAEQGGYMCRPSGRDPLSIAITRLLDTIEKRCSYELSNVVDISVSTNETAVMSANLLSDLRGVDRVSQSIAAAAEEMAVTVGEMEKHGEEIFADAKAASETAANGARIREMTDATGQVTDALRQQRAAANDVAEGVSGAATSSSRAR